MTGGLVSIVSYSRPAHMKMRLHPNFMVYLPWAFSVIVKTDCETDGSSAALIMIPLFTLLGVGRKDFLINHRLSYRSSEIQDACEG